MKIYLPLFIIFMLGSTAVFSQKILDTLNIESNYRDMKLLDSNADNLLVKSEIEEGITRYFDGVLPVELSGFKNVLGLFGYSLDGRYKTEPAPLVSPAATVAPVAAAPTKTIAPNKAFKMIGIAGLSYWRKNAFLNFGGPSVKFNYKKMGVQCSFFPSLRTNFETPVISVTPLLGAGVSVYYKKVALIAPCYYIANKNIWVVSYGIGYTF